MGISPDSGPPPLNDHIRRLYKIDCIPVGTVQHCKVWFCSEMRYANLLTCCCAWRSSHNGCADRHCMWQHCQLRGVCHRPRSPWGLVVILRCSFIPIRSLWKNVYLVVMGTFSIYQVVPLLLSGASAVQKVIVHCLPRNNFGRALGSKPVQFAVKGCTRPEDYLPVLYPYSKCETSTSSQR